MIVVESMLLASANVRALISRAHSVPTLRAAAARTMAQPKPQPKSTAERAMRDTIEWLLKLPPDVRSELSAAENHTFTLDSPAPKWGNPRAVHGSEASAAATPDAAAAAPSLDAVANSKVSRSTAFCTVDMGSAEAAAHCAGLAGARVCLLNFAHGYNCGGGFEHHGGSQEEDIFRKTSCFLSLWPHRRADDGAGVLKRGLWIGNYDAALPRAASPMYPHSPCGAIYSPSVIALRDLTAKAKAMPLLPEASAAQLPRFGLVTSAAQNLNMEGPFNPGLLREKARTILWLAATHANNVVILGAYGSGYFRNPVDAVAGTFEELLQGEFAGVFRLVVFATPRRFGQGNFDAFASRFPVVSPDELKL